jgi:hypothetical protein
MPHASHSPDRSPYVVERLYQLAHATAVAAGKPSLADHADAEREAAEEIKRLRRRIEGLEKRLSMLQELAKVSFVPDRDFSADPVDEWDGQPMARNPDRDFSAGNLSQQEQEELWRCFNAARLLTYSIRAPASASADSLAAPLSTPRTPDGIQVGPSELAAVSRRLRDSAVAALNPVTFIRIKFNLELSPESLLMVFGGLYSQMVGKRAII